MRHALDERAWRALTSWPRTSSIARLGLLDVDLCDRHVHMICQSGAFEALDTLSLSCVSLGHDAIRGLVASLPSLCRVHLNVAQRLDVERIAAWLDAPLLDTITCEVDQLDEADIARLDGLARRRGIRLALPGAYGIHVSIIPELPDVRAFGRPWHHDD